MGVEYNTEFAMHEFTFSGEHGLMEKLKGFDIKTIFDVGSNMGEWTRMVLTKMPDVKIHAFEPIPEVYQRYVNMLHPDERLMPNPFGLSKECEIRDLLFDHENDRLTTPCMELNREKPEVRTVFMIDGDNYCKSRGVETIDFLKIDTEGHEYQVLLGLKDMLEKQRIKIIQFEYGYANVLTKDLLIDFYKLLSPLGYSIGKLSPFGVDFKTYGLLDEDFKGPNYVAVLSQHEDIMEKIQYEESVGSMA